MQAVVQAWPSHSVPDMIALQGADQVIGVVREFRQQGPCPEPRVCRQLSKPVVMILRQWDRLTELGGFVAPESLPS